MQGLANLGFSWQAVVGHDVTWLTFAIVLENFTSAVGTVIFVAYLSALCRNPLHTATQYALLTALAAFGRTYLSAGAGYIVTGFGGFPAGLGVVLRDLRARRRAGADFARLAATTRSFRRAITGQEMTRQSRGSRSTAAELWRKLLVFRSAALSWGRLRTRKKVFL